MAKKNLKRLQKSKKEIVSNIQLTQDAERTRSVIRDVLFPYLVSIDESIGYTKVFLQAFSGLVEGVFDSQRKMTTIGHLSGNIKDKLNTVFKTSDPEQKKEYDRYIKLVELMKDVSVFDVSRSMELPRYIDGYLLQDKNKEKIKVVDIEKILG